MLLISFTPMPDNEPNSSESNPSFVELNKPFTDKLRHASDLMATMIKCKEELATMGYNITDKVTIDRKKWDDYFGL